MQLPDFMGLTRGASIPNSALVGLVELGRW